MPVCDSKLYLQRPASRPSSRLFTTPAPFFEISELATPSIGKAVTCADTLLPVFDLSALGTANLIVAVAIFLATLSSLPSLFQFDHAS